MLSSHDQLAEFHALLQQQASPFEALYFIAENVKKALSAERASVLVYDKEREQFWTKVGESQEKIVVPYDQGIVGKTFRTGKVQLENEPYNSSHFFAEVDMQLGYYTQNILAFPLFDANQDIIAIIELLNKPTSFTKKDKNFVNDLTQQISPHMTPLVQNRSQTKETT